MYSQHGALIVCDLNAHLKGQRFVKATDSRDKYLLDMMHYLNLGPVVQN